jgi:large subunit ribosomal protein L20
MPRAKGGPKTRRRHKKTLKLAKGYVGGRRKTYRQARETVERGLTYAYRDRKQKKREFRALWIARINAMARENGISYSSLMDGLNKAGVTVDRVDQKGTPGVFLKDTRELF